MTPVTCRSSPPEFLIQHSPYLLSITQHRPGQAGLSYYRLHAISAEGAVEVTIVKGSASARTGGMPAELQETHIPALKSSNAPPWSWESVRECRPLKGKMADRPTDTAPGEVRRRRPAVPPAEGEQSPQSESALVLHPDSQSRGFLSRLRIPLLAAGVALLLSPLTLLWPGEGPVDPTNYTERTRRVLKTTP